MELNKFERVIAHIFFSLGVYYASNLIEEMLDKYVNKIELDEQVKVDIHNFLKKVVLNTVNDEILENIALSVKLITPARKFIIREFEEMLNNIKIK